jgi:hypothetical protein
MPEETYHNAERSLLQNSVIIPAFMFTFHVKMEHRRVPCTLPAPLAATLGQPMRYSAGFFQNA